MQIKHITRTVEHLKSVLGVEVGWNIYTVVSEIEL